MAKVDLDKIHEAAKKLAQLTSPEERMASGGSMGPSWIGFYDQLIRQIVSESGYFLPKPVNQEQVKSALDGLANSVRQMEKVVLGHTTEDEVSGYAHPI